MERTFHKKAELLNFIFKDTNEEYITKRIVKLKELYLPYKYILALSSSNSIVRKYDLSFSLDKIGLSFETRYIQ